MKKLIILLFLLAGTSVAQMARFDGVVLPSGTPNGPATVAVCTSGGSGGPPCSPLAVIYDAAGAPDQNPFPADMNGHYTFFAPAGTYAVQTYGTGYATTLTTVSQSTTTPALSGANTWTGAQTFGSLSGSTSFWRVPTTSVNTSYGGAPFAWSDSVTLWQGTTNDNILTSGYNCGQSEALIVAGLPQFCDQMEIDFNDGIGNHWMEWHKDYTFDGVTYHRPFAIGTKLNNNNYADISLVIGTDNANNFVVASGTTSTKVLAVNPNGPVVSLYNNAQTTNMIWRLTGGAEAQLGGGSLGTLSSIDIGTDVIGSHANPTISITPSQFQLWNAGDLVGYSGTASGEKWRITGAGFVTAAKLNQEATNNFAGTCAMAAGTSCTATLTASFTAPICQVTPQGTSAIAGACSVSGTTVTITAASSNSLTWAYMVVGNPN